MGSNPAVTKRKGVNTRVDSNTIFYVTKIETVDKGFKVTAKTKDPEKKRQEKASCVVMDATSYHVGQPVRSVLEDAT